MSHARRGRIGLLADGNIALMGRRDREGETAPERRYTGGSLGQRRGGLWVCVGLGVLCIVVGAVTADLRTLLIGVAIVVGMLGLLRSFDRYIRWEGKRMHRWIDAAAEDRRRRRSGGV
jgi:hypothetical protein